MDSLIKFLIEIEYDTIIKIKCHNYASEYYHKWNNIFSLPVILLSTFTGSTILSAENSEPYIRYITSSFGIIIAVLSSVDKYFNFSKQSEYHSNLAKLYESLQRDINFFIKENLLEPANEDCIKNIKTFIREIHEKIENIENENNSQIPINIFEKVKKYENKKCFIKEKIKLYKQTIQDITNTFSDTSEDSPNYEYRSFESGPLQRQSSFQDMITKKTMSNINIKKELNPSQKKIIVLDDNDIHILLIKKILSYHFNTDCYSNIEFFYKKVKNNNYDLIILDYLLSNDIGTNIAEKLKKNNPNITIVCITSYDEIYSDKKKKYINYIYKKPLIKNSFLNFIKNILNEKDYSTITLPIELDSV